MLQHRTRFLPILLLLVGAGLPACASEDVAPSGDFSPRSYSDDFGAAQDSSGKFDEIVSCGEDSCEADLCGFHCVEGEGCHQACAAEDQRADTFVRAEVMGYDWVTLDSRAYTYAPFDFSVRENLLFYGCQLKPSEDGASLEIMYAEMNSLDPFAPDNGVEFRMILEDFDGAGSYRARGMYSMSGEQQRLEDFFVSPEACEVNVTRGENGVLSASYECLLPHTQEFREVHMVGNFACGANGMSRPTIVERTDASDSVAP